MLRNILALIVGLLLGGAVNMGLIHAGSLIVPPPEGVNPADIESIAANIHRYEATHFLVPLVAHAAGTFVGAMATTKLARSHSRNLALLVGAFFLIGGIVAASMMPAPTWFIGTDLLLAYLPMAWLGWRLVHSEQT